jgi:diacylglycerol kinase (ATP)
MRAAAILRPGSASRAIARFERLTGVVWTSLLEKPDVGVLFGGDGTIHRHLAELVKLDVPLLVVPCGSGNDFARALGIRSARDSAEAFRRFQNDGSTLRSIDLGVICAESATEPGRQHYFCCVAGVGIDGNIARRANRLPRWLRGRGGYAISAPREFLRFKPFPRMKVSANGNSGTSKPTILAAVANTPMFGGGMQIAPHAKLDDGKLDLCVVNAMSVLKLFCLFPTVYWGRHLGFEEVEYTQTPQVRIEAEYPIDVWADGEYISQTPVSIGISQKALKVLTCAPRL